MVTIQLGRRRTSKILVFIAIVVIAVAFLAFVFVLLPRLLVTANDIASPSKRIDAQNSVRTAAAQLLGVLGLAAGAVFTARTFRLNREGQITERFGRAIDQLGSTELDVQLGGIYALERIARDSKRDHGPIMEVLTAYVRRRCKAREPSDIASSGPTFRTLETDLQAVLTVLGRRNLENETEEKPTLDLRETVLRYAEVSGDLRGADLRLADLRHAHLHDLDLRGAKLDYCRLECATIAATDLRNASFGEAHFEAATLTSDLRQARDIDTVFWDSLTRWSPREFRPSSNPRPRIAVLGAARDFLPMIVEGLVPGSAVRMRGVLENGGSWDWPCEWELASHEPLAGPATTEPVEIVVKLNRERIVQTIGISGIPETAEIYVANPSPGGGDSDAIALRQQQLPATWT